MAAEKGIDPRYAAQYQRGYDPARHPPASALSGASAARPAPAPAQESDRVTPAPGSDAPGEPDGPEGHDEHEAHDEAPRRRIDVAWALPLLSGATLVLAVVLLTQSLANPAFLFGAVSQQDYAWMTLRAALPGPLLVVSSLAFTGWMVVLAVRRAGRRP